MFPGRIYELTKTLDTQPEAKSTRRSQNIPSILKNYSINRYRRDTVPIQYRNRLGPTASKSASFSVFFVSLNDGTDGDKTLFLKLFPQVFEYGPAEALL